MAEALFEDGLGDGAGPLRRRQQRHDRRLEIGGESRMGTGLDIDAEEAAGRAARDQPALGLAQVHTGRLQRRQGRPQQVEAPALQQEFAVGHRRRAGESAQFDPVGDHVVHGAAQRLPALDRQRVAAQARDPRAHAEETGRQIGDFRFARGIADGRRAARQHGGQHQVLRGADGRLRQQDVRPGEAGRRGGLDDTGRDLDARAHGTKTGEMEIDGAQADVVAARQRQACLAASREKRPQQQDRGAHAADEAAVDGTRIDPVGADRDRQAGSGRRPVQFRAQPLQQGRQHGDVERGRHVAQGDEMRSQQGADHQRQHRVLRAAQRVAAVEWPAAADPDRLADRRPPPRRRALQWPGRRKAHRRQPSCASAVKASAKASRDPARPVSSKMSAVRD